MAEIPEKSLSTRLIETAWKELVDHPVATIAAIIAILAAGIAFTKKGTDLLKSAIHWIYWSSTTYEADSDYEMEMGHK